MTQLQKTKKDLSKQLLNTIKSIPYVEIKKSITKGKSETDPDMRLNVKTPQGVKKLFVAIDTNGQPRLTRNAINRLLLTRQSFPNSYGIFVAPYISEKSAEICKKSNIGYVDGVGNCYLNFDQIYILKQGIPNLKAAKRDLKSLYSLKAERVLRVLLNDPKQAWKLKDLSGDAQVSVGQVYNVKKQLLNREWMESKESGIQLVKPGLLLDEWAENYSFIKRNTSYTFFTLMDLKKFEKELAQICQKQKIPYAFTGFSSAAQLAPFVPYRVVSVYVGKEIKKLAKLLDLKEKTSGSNVTLIVPKDDEIFYGSQDKNGLKTASPIQVYLDLKGRGDRGDEAAQFLREQVIEPSWK